jgi:hypothetical protein
VVLPVTGPGYEGDHLLIGPHGGMSHDLLGDFTDIEAATEAMREEWEFERTSCEAEPDGGSNGSAYGLVSTPTLHPVGRDGAAITRSTPAVGTCGTDMAKVVLLPLTVLWVSVTAL